MTTVFCNNSKSAVINDEFIKNQPKKARSFIRPFLTNVLRSTQKKKSGHPINRSFQKRRRKHKKLPFLYSPSQS